MWLEAPEESYVPDLSQLPPHTREAAARACESQSAIGWDHAFSGFLSRDWRHVAALDMLRFASFDEDNAIIRIRKVLRSLHEFTHTIWTERNTVLHNGDLTSEMANIYSTDVAEITSYHQQRHLLRFDDRHLCDRPLQSLLQGSAATRRRWLRLVKRSCATYAKEGQTQRTISSFFPQK